jgi:hypothetical protein
MDNLEYLALIQSVGFTQKTFSAQCQISQHTIEARCRPARTRITAKAELHLLRFVAGRLLGKPLSPPMPRIRHAREVPFERKRKRVGRKVAQGDAALAALIGAKQPSPTRPQLCAAPGCLRQPGTPERLYCALHEPDAAFRGLPIMR